MARVKMHDDEVDVAADDVARLIAAQFPDWAGASIARVPSDGTVNAMFRLGEDKVVRLPLVPAGSADIAREAETLARLEAAVRADVPRLLGRGEPDADYPFAWSVLEWLPGRLPDPESLADELGLADDLAAFLGELRAAPADGAPPAYRGGGLERLRELDGPVRECLAQVADLVDAAGLTEQWARVLSGTPSAEPPRWLHSDLLPSNVLVDAAGRLSGVLDWPTAGVGDASGDLLAAWNILGPAGRGRLRERLAVEDAAWSRGRGWALSQAAIALPYYRDTNPGMRRMALRALTQLALPDSP
jgi:aminoglycoside phosphotransferase (APT) family kinase protein